MNNKEKKMPAMAAARAAFSCADESRQPVVSFILRKTVVLDCDQITGNGSGSAEDEKN